ncbi:MAG: glycosyltransferase family 2 protein [Promethearchaeota archaeon]
MDEIFFIYVEETDWNYRAKKKGYKIIYFPDIAIYHKVNIITFKTNRIIIKISKSKKK